MNEKFINISTLTTIQFYGLIFRLDAINIKGASSYYCVTCRTSNSQDEYTKIFDNIDDAKNQFKLLLSTNIKGGAFFLK